ncbi:phosphatase PAP2 family protein [Paenibacillus segetis]|uniref:Phosphatidylglycerophosphatase B n=1 Tax=Paenibacillus segetis TaxID=1325360 RepID=A0ABQ1YB37_9BACL|nr:phosphatase PAP2 family protein [Paenibacillus segetis]GGH19489.1 phosphatidylglycerophosphatase B [Paenibacillus segetis]
MNSTKQSRPSFVLLYTSVIYACLFGLIAIAVGNLKIEQFDHVIISYVQGMESPTLTTVMKFFTWIGGGLPVIVIIILTMVVLFVFLRHRKELIFLVTVVIGSALINMVLKHLFSRSRPDFHRLIEVGGYSFPSGHSMSAFSFYGALAYLLWRHIPGSLGRVILIVLSSMFILFIGLSRIYLGVHYPSDVLGAYLVSSCWLSCSIWGHQRLMEHSNIPHI